MSEQDWKTLVWFQYGERNQRGLLAFPEPERMSRDLMLLMDSARDYIGQPFIVHYSTDGAHNLDSLHYTAAALDGHFKGLSAVEQYLLMEQFNPPGLGFYPFWRSPGIHVDVRSIRPARKAARWWQNEHGAYQPVTLKDIGRFLGNEGEGQ